MIIRNKTFKKMYSDLILTSETIVKLENTIHKRYVSIMSAKKWEGGNIFMCIINGERIK